MLTEKQEKFALNVFNGMNLTDAYKDSYNCENMSDNAIYVEASRLNALPKVALRIKEMRDELLEPDIMSAKERLKWLSDIVRDEEQSTRDRLSASDQMNKMQGQYIQKIEATVDSVNVNVELVED